MIYYFSGTGNSRIVAQELGRLLGCDVAEMGARQEIPDLGLHESLGLVFPVYAWGLPDIVERFVAGIKGKGGERTHLWAVMTCGDDMGYADEVLDSSLGKNSLRTDAVYSVQMPNTYVCLPGFDVDAPEVARKKIEETCCLLPAISESIRKRTCERRVVRGAFPWIKTYVLRPLFNRFLLTDSHFQSRKTQCTLCGLCERQCPTGNIRVSDGTVRWGNSSCTGCLRCYHQCPQRAIEWGRTTQGKGQKERVEKYWKPFRS